MYEFRHQHSLEIIEIMENYISGIRPEPEMRGQFDIAYEIDNQSIILNQIRPFWDDPTRIMTLGYAKATYVKASDVWKVYWKRADNTESGKVGKSVKDKRSTGIK